MSNNASVTIPYSEFQALQKSKQAAETAMAEMRAQIAAQKIEASDPQLLALSRAALDIVRYAVATIVPESNVGWPFESLRVFATYLEQMPDATQDHFEMAQTFRIFAKECEDHERRRKQQREVRQAPISTVDLVAPAPRDP